MKGSVYERGTTLTYRSRRPEQDLSTGEYPWISEGGRLTKKQAPKARRDEIRKADTGRFVRPSTRALAEFFDESFAAVQTSFGAIAWFNWNDDYAHAHVLPRIGGAPLQRPDEPQLQKLCARPLTKGRVKRDQNHKTFQYWTVRVVNHYGSKGS